jgi:4-alpha-glucanotransferase
MRFHAYVQWIAFDQWSALRDFATARGVALIGDIPVGVSRYSADVWGEPEIFDLTLSSGAPPEKVFKSDPFTEKWGQNWGFPLYAWDRMSRDDFAWWRRRMRVQTAIFDMLRVDHALGFFRIYSFPWPPHENDRFTTLSPDEARAITGGRLPGFVPRDDSTPENRDHNRRLGEMLFRILLEETGPHRILAEDLGEVAPYVRPTLATLEIPGFKIPQWERLPNGKIIPGSDYQRLSLATYATHDHPPMKVLWNDLASSANSGTEEAGRALDELNALLAFAGQKPTRKPAKYSPALQTALLEALLASNSWLVVPMITDILGTTDRFNVPGSTGDANWTRRISQPVNRWNQTWANEVQAFRKSVATTKRGKFVS